MFRKNILLGLIISLSLSVSAASLDDVGLKSTDLQRITISSKAAGVDTESIKLFANKVSVGEIDVIEYHASESFELVKVDVGDANVLKVINYPVNLLSPQPEKIYNQ